jgi:hypothetical protein
MATMLLTVRDGATAVDVEVDAGPNSSAGTPGPIRW